MPNEKIKQGQYRSNKAKEKTVAELIDLYIKDVVVDHHKAVKESVRLLNYFRNTLGSYALTYITPELLLKERRKLSGIPTRHNTKPNPATINPYFFTLNGAFRFACKNLRWIDENPCINLLKLKSKPKERRVLIEGEDIRLLQACGQSQSPYLYCIVLVALTTRARKSEILHLTWDAIDFENRMEFYNEDRMTRLESYKIPLTLTWIGCIPPAALATYLRQAQSYGSDADGFMQRFQIVTFPDINQQYETCKETMPSELESRLQPLFIEIDKGALSNSGRVLHFDETAQQRFDTWQIFLENDCRSGQHPTYWESHLEKQSKLLASICIMLHRLFEVWTNQSSNAISIGPVA